MQQFSLHTKFLIVAGVVAFAAFSYFVYSALGGGTTVQTVDSTNLVGHWTFDNADMEPNVRDISGQGNHGSLIHGGSGTTTASGARGEALEFDGSDDYVQVFDSILDNSSFTASAWFSRQSTGASHFILDNGTFTNGGFQLFIDNTDVIRGRIDDSDTNGGTFDTTTTITDTSWHHVVLVANKAGVAQLYLDGVQDGATLDISSYGDISGTENLRIGEQDTFSDPLPNKPFNGILDDVRIYSEALSEAEIKRLYQFGAEKRNLSRSLGTLADGLVGHWTFDAGEMANNVADASGQGNHGNLQGQTSITTAIGKIGQALSFDGVDDYVSIGTTNLQQSFPMSFSAWVRPTLGSTGLVVGNDGEGNESWSGLNVFVNGDGAVQGLIGDNTGGTSNDRKSFNSDTAIADGAWSHILVVFNGISDVDIYINGEEDTTSSSGSAASLAYGGTNGQIGYADTGDNFPYSGQIDDVRIYDRALSEGEINRLYHLGATTKINQSVSTPNSDLSTGLVGHWSFDARDLVPNVRDTSGNSNHGALQGQTSTTTTIGKIGQALEFDGSDDYVAVGTNNFSTGSGAEWTIAAWVKPAALLSNYAIAGYGNGGPDGTPHLLLTNQSKWRVSTWGSGNDLDSSEDASVGMWTHVVGVGSGSNIDLYINGSFDVSKSVTNNPVLDRARIGATPQNFSNLEFDGQIDDVRIYNRALSVDEVKRLYEMGR